MKAAVYEGSRAASVKNVPDTHVERPKKGLTAFCLTTPHKTEDGRRRLRFRRRGSLQRRAGRTAARYLRRPQLPGVAGRGQGAANRLRDALRHVPHRLARGRARPAAWSRPGRPSRPGSSPTNSYWTALRRPRRRLDEGRPHSDGTFHRPRADSARGIFGRALHSPVRKRDADRPCRVSLPLASYNQRLVKGAVP